MAISTTSPAASRSRTLGATFVSHWRTKSMIDKRKAPDIVSPDLVVTDSGGKLELGGTTLELLYLGKNHGDNSLVMRLPKEKIIFVVDFLPLSGTQFRIMADTYLPDQEDTMKKILDDGLGSADPRPSRRSADGRSATRRTSRPTSTTCSIFRPR